MIYICDFVVRSSRQLNGKTTLSERPKHVMREHDRCVGIIFSFNFPVVFWTWNTALARICGDVCVWKGRKKINLCAIACQNIIRRF